MEINIEKELQTLKSQYNMFKEGLEKQETLNEKFFKSLRKRPAMAVSREIRDRMLGDVVTVPMIIVCCISIDWPILFGILYWCRCGRWPTWVSACGSAASWA